jgi:hypothetical protein
VTAPFKPAFVLRGVSAPEAAPAQAPRAMVARAARPPEGGNWTWLVNGLFEMGLGPHAGWTYAYLSRRASKDGLCSPGIRGMAKALDISPNGVKAALRKLADAGLVRIIRRPRRQSNTYQVMVPLGVSNGATPAAEVYQTELHRVSNGDTPGVSNGATPPGRGVSNGGTEVDVVEDGVRRVRESGHAHTLRSESTATAEADQGASPDWEEPTSSEDLFEMFYATFPRKGKKREARAEWARIAPNTFQAGAMMFSANEHRKLPAWTENRGQFIPSAHKFLLDEMWTRHLDQYGALMTDAEPEEGKE